MCNNMDFINPIVPEVTVNLSYNTENSKKKTKF